jgi:hypothetical protein
MPRGWDYGTRDGWTHGHGHRIAVRMIIEMGAILGAGVANFAMHRWMLESGHPAVDAATGPLRRVLGQHATYVFEFGFLVGAMFLAETHSIAALALYGIYTALNAATVAWLKGSPGD